MEEFDLVVLGGGPGGYPAAIRAAQKGLKVALVEAGLIGGTCLNRGCIPTKTLIANADVLRQVRRSSEFGISTGPVSFDYGKMVDRKDQVVAKVRRGLEGLIAANKITLKRGFGTFRSPQEIAIETPNGEEVIKAKKTIIATGSEPRDISQFHFDGKRIHNSTTILELKELPKKLIIVGGGVIGCEFASLYHAFGVEVIVLEMLPALLANECKSVSSFLTKSFLKRGIQVRTDVKVDSIDSVGDCIQVRLGSGDVLSADMALIAIGRLLNTAKIGLDKAGVKIKDNGMLEVNEYMETSVSGIYAVGDIASKWWLAHAATHQGVIAAENAAGGHQKMHYEAIPVVIFTEPEIATVGISYDEAVRLGYDATVALFPFQALGKAQASQETEGFTQIVQDKKTKQILGAQVVGHDASNLIAEMTLAMANELTSDCVSGTIHAHPTIAEAWMESALLANDEPLHLPPKRKS